MPSANLALALDAGGVNIQKSRSVSGDGTIGVQPTLALAHALSSWVKTDADTAAGNLAADHGLSTGTFDIYWTGGARYDVVCTITTNAVALDGGTGTDFPATANATVVMAPRTSINVSIDGDSLKCLAIELGYSADPAATSRGRILFEDAAGDDILSLPITADKAMPFDIEAIVAAGLTNPFTGDPITTAKASQESTSQTATLKICGIVDATP